MRRVVITGVGLVSPLGHTREETWQRVLAGECGAAPITAFDASAWPTRFACEVRGFALTPEASAPGFDTYLSRSARFGLQAALEAMTDSGVLGTVPAERFGVAIGAGVGAISPPRLARLLHAVDHGEDLTALEHKGDAAFGGYEMLKNHPGMIAALLAKRWEACGPVTTIHTACASSGQSLGQAYLQIKRGEADAILAGGADSLAGELLLAGFCLLGALSTRNDDPKAASRPFDQGRDGFVAGEGAAMLVLEERERALARGATIYAELGGYADTESAYRITDLPEDGRGIVEAMELAVADAGVPHAAVGYINAHGTSTQLNDRIEALAVRRVFGSRGLMPRVSSTKSAVGHLISAAGAMEAAFATLAVRDGVVPPNRNLTHTDCGDGVLLAKAEAEKVPLEAALSNSIGFGGSNSVVLVRRATP